MIQRTDILHAKILIVDDQLANVVLLEQILQRAGYTTLTSTTDPNQVFALHLANRYDLILLDLQMPGLDGFQVMENLTELEDSGYLPVLVITAQPDHKLRALTAGARDFISKPFDIAEVLLRVHNLIEVRLLYREARTLHQNVLAERRVAERLLLHPLPAAVTERLARRSETAAAHDATVLTDSFAEVTVLFADIVEFTQFAESASAYVLLGVLESLAAVALTPDDDAGRARTRIVGDAYLAAIGLSDLQADRAVRAANLALDMVMSVDEFNARSRYKLRVRIGVDAHTAWGKNSAGRTLTFDL